MTWIAPARRSIICDGGNTGQWNISNANWLRKTKRIYAPTRNARPAKAASVKCSATTWRSFRPDRIGFVRASAPRNTTALDDPHALHHRAARSDGGRPGRTSRARRRRILFPFTPEYDLVPRPQAGDVE